MATKPVITPFIWATDVNYTTGPAPLIGTPTKVTTPTATIDEGWKADETPPAQWFNFNFNHTTQWTNWVSFGSSVASVDAHIMETDSDGIARVKQLILDGTPAGRGLGQFGSGDDGDVTLGGGVTELTRDMAYNNLTVPVGATLKNRGFRVFVRETLTLRGVISSTGDDASGSGGGINGTGTSIINTLGRGGLQGGDGELLGNGDNADDGSRLKGGAGGVGGDAGAFTGGLASIFNSDTTIEGTIETIHSALGYFMMHDSNDVFEGKIGGGSSGGGGAGDDVEGGGGGGAGGVICIWANVFDSDGTVEADGGDGADSATSGAGTDAGGGGGGGGGVIFMVRRSTGALGSGTFSVAAGSGGSGFGGSGTAGAAGAVGKILQFVV